MVVVVVVVEVVVAAVDGGWLLVVVVVVVRVSPCTRAVALNPFGPVPPAMVPPTRLTSR